MIRTASLLVFGALMASGTTVLAQQTPSEQADDSVSVSGDFRLRGELDTNRGGGRGARARERIRFRLGVNVRLTDELDVGARMSTGNPRDPKSPHQTLNDLFSRKEFNLDRAFVRYEPEGAGGLWLIAGKFGHPFVTPAIYNELLWDADVQPEGVMVGWSRQLDGTLRHLLLAGGHYVTLEQSGSDDGSMAAIQGAVQLTGDRWSANAALAYYGIIDTEPGGRTTLVEANQGNALVDRDSDGVPDAFASDFDIFDAFVDLTYRWRIPVTFLAQLFKNAGAGSSPDIGYQLGIQTRRGRVRAWYTYAHLEQDAAFSLFTQDDYLHTIDFKGHQVGANLTLRRNVALKIWNLTSKSLTAGADGFQNRFRTDLNISF